MSERPQHQSIAPTRDRDRGAIVTARPHGVDRPLRFWHGGVPGLRPGDLLTGGHHRPTIAGCAFCAAREAGGALSFAGQVIDPPSTHPDRVYVTTDREYARHYASLYGYGDLYRVDPVGQIEPSSEDLFATWTVPAARVLAVYDRAVLLTPGQRRALYRRWP